MTSRRVTVTVDEGHLAQVLEVAEALSARGMRVESVLEGLGMVTGEADDPQALRDVEGVESVDARLRHDVGPPDADVQDAPDVLDAPDVQDPPDVQDLSDALGDDSGRGADRLPASEDDGRRAR